MLNLVILFIQGELYKPGREGGHFVQNQTSEEVKNLLKSQIITNKYVEVIKLSVTAILLHFSWFSALAINCKFDI